VDTKKLRQKILDLAIHGKLVPQDPNDEPASVLLERIRAEKELMIKEGKIKKSKKVSKSSDTPHYEQVPFEVPEGWVWTTLGEISTYGECNTITIDEIGKDDWILELEDLEKDTAAIIQTLTKKERSIKGVRHKFCKGEVLYSKLRTYLNKVLVAPNDGYCTTEIMPFNSFCSISTDYLCHVLRSSYFLGYTLQCGYGVKMPRLSTNDARKGMIPLPPLAEQLRIVNEIERSFAAINTLENSKTHLQTAIKQAKNKILDLAIHGKLVPQDPNDEPASELLKRINPKVEITCDNAHYPQLPSGWAYSRLGDICKLKNGYAFKSGLYSTQGVRIIRIANVQDGYIEDDAPQYYDFDKMKGLDSFLLSDGDLLMSLTGNVGRVCFITKKFLPAALNQRVACVRNNEVPINKEYLFHLFQSEKFVKDCKNSGKGVAQQNISTEWLKEYIVPLPPLLEQDRIVTLIKGIYSYLDTIMDGL